MVLNGEDGEEKGWVIAEVRALQRFSKCVGLHPTDRNELMFFRVVGRRSWTLSEQRAASNVSNGYRLNDITEGKENGNCT